MFSNASTAVKNKRADPTPPPVTGKRSLSMFRPRLTVIHNSYDDHPPLAALEALGDQELPDATLTEVQRRTLKSEVFRLEERYSSYELMFLSSALEPAAERKRSEELRCE
jgi:hypothetical protein